MPDYCIMIVSCRVYEKWKRILSWTFLDPLIRQRDIFERIFVGKCLKVAMNIW
jgi:hypothetical protein